MDFLVLGLNFKTSFLAEREAWTLTPERRIPFLKSLVSERGVQGVVYLSTCNRVEIYVACEESQLLVEKIGAPKNSYVYHNGEAMRHLLRVACGLDSMVLGETEIFGQVKEAYLESLELKTTGPLLNFLFQKVFKIAKQVRTETGLSRYPVSVSSVGMMLLEQIFGEFKEVEVLLMGLGEMGTQMAQALVKRNVRKLWLTNRSRDKAKEWAERLGVTAAVVSLTQWRETLQKVDLVITASAAPDFLISEGELSAQKGTKVLLDLGVPRNIDPVLDELKNIFLYNVDDLKTIAQKNLANREAEARLAIAMIEKHASDFELEWKKRSHFLLANMSFILENL